MLAGLSFVLGDARDNASADEQRLILLTHAWHRAAEASLVFSSKSDDVVV